MICRFSISKITKTKLLFVGCGSSGSSIAMPARSIVTTRNHRFQNGENNPGEGRAQTTDSGNNQP